MNKALLYYLLISFGLCWMGGGLIPLFDLGYGSIASTLIVALVCMPAPALAGWLVQTRVLKRPFAEIELGWKQADLKHLYFFTPVWLFVFLLANFGWIFLLGNVLKLEMFGQVDFSADGLLLKLEEMSRGKTDFSEIHLPRPWFMFLIIGLAGIVGGATVNLPFTLGEEIGWRGFLYKQWETMPAIKRILLTGTIWGLWHAPLILQGHNYTDHPYLGIIMMVVFCVALSFPMDWLRKNSRTVLAPGIFHGMVNASAAGTVLFIQNGDTLFGSIAGLTGALACMTLFGIQVFMIKIIRR